MQETNETIDMLSQMLNSVSFPEQSTSDLEARKQFSDLNDNKISSTVGLGKEIKIY